MEQEIKRGTRVWYYDMENPNEVSGFYTVVEIFDGMGICTILNKDREMQVDFTEVEIISQED